MSPIYFASAADFRRWLETNHATATVLLVGFYNMASGKGGLTYPEALDEALCFGWIDGVRNKIDAASYSIRFTPRRPGSVWSQVNIRHVARLKKRGQMAPAGLKAFAARDARHSGYSFENRPKKLPATCQKQFRADKTAWAFFRSQAPWYQRVCAFWVVSAKQEETRQRRLAQLIADSSAGRRIKPLAGPTAKAN